jgi:hypothetical protein
MIKHINEIKLNGDDKFTEQFNLCSDYYQKSQDELLSNEERKNYFEGWLQERYRLESGNY